MNLTAKQLSGEHIGQYISCQRTSNLPRLLWKIVHEPLLVALVYIDAYGNKTQIGVTHETTVTIQDDPYRIKHTQT